jgi:hypothetical protein
MLQAGVDPIDDPLDTVGRLKLWNNATVKAAAEKAVMSPFAPAPTFNGRNRIATAISAGADSRDQPEGQKYWAFRDGNHNGSDHTSNDNAYGFRVGRQGNKGE